MRAQPSLATPNQLLNLILADEVMLIVIELE